MALRIFRLRQASKSTRYLSLFHERDLKQLYPLRQCRERLEDRNIIWFLHGVELSTQLGWEHTHEMCIQSASF
jgi:hypothetical protein